MEIKKMYQPKQPIYKVIPLAFDESMSYYEQLCCLIAKMNELINVFNDTITEELQEYIEEHFNDIMLNAMYDSDTETLTLYLDEESEE